MPAPSSGSTACRGTPRSDRSLLTRTAWRACPPARNGHADHAFWVKALKLAGGSTIKLALDDATGRLTIDTTETAAKGIYDIRMERDAKMGRQLYAHPGLELQPGETATLEYGKWTHHGEGIPLVTRIGGVEQRIILAD